MDRISIIVRSGCGCWRGLLEAVVVKGDSAKTGKGQGAGVGAGIGIDPIGFLVTKGSEISFMGTHQEKGLSKIFQQVPDLIMKFVEKRETAKV